eukprot:g4682.t1
MYIYISPSLSPLTPAHSISISSVCVVAGKLGDRLGGDRVFKFGLLCAGIFNLGQFWAPTFALRLTARIIASCAYALGSANSGPNYLRIVGPKLVPICLALNTLVGTVAMIVAPIIGGIIGGLSSDPLNPSWPYIYLVISVACFLWFGANCLWLPKTARISEGQFDIVGALMFSVAIFCLVFGIAAIPMDMVSTAASVVSLAAFVIIVPFLLRHEARHPSPILPTKLLSHKKAKNT